MTARLRAGWYQSDVTLRYRRSAAYVMHNGWVDRLQAIETYWSDQARTFDDEPDHGLADPHVRAAWAARLTHWVPFGARRVADLGCGTGSLYAASVNPR